MVLPKAAPPPPPPSPPSASDIDRLANLIIQHPPSLSLSPLLRRHLPLLSSSPSFLPSLLLRLLSSHSPSLHSLRLFLFSLHSLPSSLPPSPLSLHALLHSLSRSRLFSLSLSLLRRLSLSHPSLLTPRSLSIPLSRLSASLPFPSALSFFHDAHRIWSAASLPFGVDHFNVLLRAFCAQSRMPEARSLFNLLHHRFPPNSKTLNTLLLGFRQSNDLLAFDLFYHDMLLRGFRPDAVTANIRIDAYCKKNRFSDAVEVFEEMQKRGLSPTVETMTTLIHGAGIARNPYRARRLFDEISERGMEPDRGAYNALMGSLIRAGDLKGGMGLMEEMEEKGIGVDDVSYYTVFCGLKRAGGEMERACEVFRKMVGRGFVPRVRTVMLLMKYFCESRRLDLGLELWGYLIGKGCCPHRHALDLLVIGLCSAERVAEGYECFRQVVDRGGRPTDRCFRILEGVLVRSKETAVLEELRKTMERLESQAPASSSSIDFEEEMVRI